MTFERFYSIMWPHKAASVNTVRRAKIIIVCIVIAAILYGLPFYFLTTPNGTSCVFFGKNMHYLAAKIYLWIDQMVYMGIPFVTLMSLNSVIIHTLRVRSKSMLTGPKSLEQSNEPAMKNSEKQIVMMLLLVSFSYLILMIPITTFAIYTFLVDYTSSPKKNAIFILLSSLAQKGFSTNYGINFYLYVISGQKFRSDVRGLFRNWFCSRRRRSGRKATSVTNITSLS